ncbi:hypothetical protein SAY86_022634 [Trapa natans]|uniref:Uncharacterized protein n=1 Tax=Trapa natans TaxID=22666 RepID=A0AAN7R4M7_TRANT|nr:hypothetical protein SAY86_022634 [Trapa natans]
MFANDCSVEADVPREAMQLWTLSPPNELSPAMPRITRGLAILVAGKTVPEEITAAVAVTMLGSEGPPSPMATGDSEVVFWRFPVGLCSEDERLVGEENWGVVKGKDKD